MADLTFLFGQMGAGKTASLLSTAFQLRQAGRQVTVLTSNDRVEGKVSSRIGLSLDATVVRATDDLTAVLTCQTQDDVLVDEAQFLTTDHVDQLAAYVDDHQVDVTCFGLRADFTGTLFPGSARLFAIADRIEELQVAARCWCGNRATHNGRTVDGRLVTTGAQVVVDDGTTVAYEPLCRRHHRNQRCRSQAGLAAVA